MGARVELRGLRLVQLITVNLRVSVVGGSESNGGTDFGKNRADMNKVTATSSGIAIEGLVLFSK